MARAKNRGLQQSFSPSYTVRRWRLGEYIRLSKEDLKKGKDDSNSVINQRDLLNDFYQKPVSYTHLDVYKRQILFLCSAAFLKARAFVSCLLPMVQKHQSKWKNNRILFCLTSICPERTG